MRPHGLSAILISGWILMAPPIHRDGPSEYSIDKWERDVSDWTPLEAFDTAALCEAESSRRVKVGSQWLAKKAARGEVDLGDPAMPSPNPHYSPSQADMEEFQANARMMSTRCVPSEHVYPPKAGDKSDRRP